MLLGIIIKPIKRIADERGFFTKIMTPWDDPLVVPVKVDGLSGGSPCNLPWDQFFLHYNVALDGISDF